MIDEDAIRRRWEAIGSKLDERAQRMFAAAEVRTAGWGGLKAVARITGLARSTINRGEDDLDGEPLPEGQVRREGGGRKPVAVTDPETRKLSGRDEPHHRHLEVSETGAACMHKLVYMLLVAVPLAKLDAASACYMTNQPSDEDLFAKASTVSP